MRTKTMISFFVISILLVSSFANVFAINEFDFGGRADVTFIRADPGVTISNRTNAGVTLRSGSAFPIVE